MIARLNLIMTWNQHLIGLNGGWWLWTNLRLFSSRKGIVFEKISSTRCHSQAFLWDVYFGRHFISKHVQDDKQKRTREGIGKVYQSPKTIPLKFKTSLATFKNARLTLLFNWSYKSGFPIEHTIYFIPGEKLSKYFFWESNVELSVLIISSKMLFSIHVYFLKKDFLFIDDLAVVTASFIKTSIEIDPYSILPNQHFSSILKYNYHGGKSLVTPNFFGWISIALTTIYLSPTAITWEKILP